MIFGNDRSLRFIAAKNLPGYDSFLTPNFNKSFDHEEPLEIFYPPDTEAEGTKYEFQTQQGLTTVFGNFLLEASRKENAEDRLLNFRKDFPYPYQSDVSFRLNFDLNTPFPVAISGMTNDRFFMEGSVIKGINSEACRFYAGPFKGYSKELENLCADYENLNSKDQSDCDSYRLGSFYEPNYSPTIHDVFQYVGEPRQRVDPLSPFNPSFMRDNPFGFLYYTWLNIPDRKNRPIPYNLDAEKGNYCALISPRHAIVFSETDIDTNNLTFFSQSSGLTSPTVQTTVSSFKEIWDAIGFVNENKDAETLSAFNEMAKNFEGVKILTFAEELPSDIYNVVLYDPYKSDYVFHAMMFGQEGRGHVCTICPPLTEGMMECNINFDSSGKCSEILELNNEKDCGCMGNKTPTINFPLPSSTTTVGSFGLDDGDIGSPLITYRTGIPMFLGFISKQDVLDGNSIAKAKVVGIGSTKQYSFPWGSSFSPFDILNRYLKLTNQSALNFSIVRYPTDTSFSHPLGDDFPVEISTPDGTVTLSEEDIRECEGAIVNKAADCVERAGKAIGCECQQYFNEKNWLLAYFCLNKACDVLRKYMRNFDFVIPFSCPPMCSRNPRFSPQFALYSLLGALLAKIREDPCIALQLIENGFLNICNKDANDALNNRPCVDSDGNPTVPTGPVTPPDLSPECLERIRMWCRLRPDVLVDSDAWKGTAMACVIAQIFTPEYNGLSQQERDQRDIDCFLRFCPPEGVDLGPQCTGRVSCRDYVYAFWFGIDKYPIPNCRTIPISPYPPSTLTGPESTCSDPKY